MCIRDNLFTYVKSQGINTISVKVAVNPTRDNAYLSLDNAIKTLKEAKAAGLQTNLVLLYSDEMTYAGTQKLPVGWTSDNATEKAKSFIDSFTLIHGDEFYREDVNKIDFIIRDDQDHLDAITAFPHLAHNTWGDKGDLALFSDLGPTGINKKTCH